MKPFVGSRTFSHSDTRGGGSSLMCLFSGSRTLPISFGRKLETVEQSSSTTNAADNRDPNYAVSFSHDANVNLLKEEITEKKTSLVASHSVETPGKHSTKLTGIRRWLRPWKWLKSKRDGSEKLKNHKKSAEMEDVNVVHAVQEAGYGEYPRRVDASLGTSRITCACSDSMKLGYHFFGSILRSLVKFSSRIRGAG